MSDGNPPQGPQGLTPDQVRAFQAAIEQQLKLWAAKVVTEINVHHAWARA